MDDHEICNLRIGTFGGVIPTQMGPVIAIFNQAAHNPTGKTIISCFQAEDNGLEIHDKSTAHGGRQCIVTPEGYIVGLDNHSGLMHVPIRPFTNSEAETLPTIIFTRDTPWDPSKHDLTLSNDTRWMLSKQQDIPGSLHDGFDLTGEYIAQMHEHNTMSHMGSIDEQSYIDIAVNVTNLQPSILSQARGDTILAANLNHIEQHERTITRNPPDYDSERIFFLNAPIDVVRRTRNATTNFYNELSSPMHIVNHYRSPLPAVNIPRRNEQVATDTVYCDTKAWGGGATCAQVFVGRLSRFIHIYGIYAQMQSSLTL